MTCVLVLEDEPFIAMDLGFAFEDVSVRALIAATCAEARQYLAEEQIDAALLDGALVQLGRACAAALLRPPGPKASNILRVTKHGSFRKRERVQGTNACSSFFSCLFPC